MAGPTLQENQPGLLRQMGLPGMPSIFDWRGSTGLMVVGAMTVLGRGVSRLRFTNGLVWCHGIPCADSSPNTLRKARHAKGTDPFTERRCRC